MTHKAILAVENGFLVAGEPFWALKFENGQTYLAESGFEGTNPNWVTEESDSPFEVLEQFWQQNICDQNGRALVGFIGYDFAFKFEPKTFDFRKPLLPFPSLFFTGYRKVRYQTKPELMVGTVKLPSISFRSLVSDEQYKTMVEAALEHIKAGNLYEINLSKPILGECAEVVNSERLFQKLYTATQAPFAALLPLDGNRAICSSSPECFLLKQGPKVSTFPIKGTRKRSTDPQEDQKYVEDLRQSLKERAEHLMVVDLERNDLGKVAVPGSVKVHDFLKLHTFPHIHHLISEVSCQLKPPLNIFDVIKKTFPSGSITGAPKVKVMQIIKEVEPFPRSAYTGTLGYIDSKGDAQFSILIRSFLVNGSKLVLNVGGGIVADSKPEFELEETYVKAQALLEIFERDLS